MHLRKKSKRKRSQTYYLPNYRSIENDRNSSSFVTSLKKKKGEKTRDRIARSTRTTGTGNPCQESRIDGPPQIAHRHNRWNEKSRRVSRDRGRKLGQWRVGIGEGEWGGNEEKKRFGGWPIVEEEETSSRRDPSATTLASLRWHSCPRPPPPPPLLRYLNRKWNNRFARVRPHRVFCVKDTNSTVVEREAAWLVFSTSILLVCHRQEDIDRSLEIITRFRFNSDGTLFNESSRRVSEIFFFRFRIILENSFLVLRWIMSFMINVVEGWFLSTFRFVLYKLVSLVIRCNNYF